MIDYLELLFVPDVKKEQGGEEFPALSGLKVESEPVEVGRAVIPGAEEGEKISTKPAGDVEVFRRELLRLGEETPRDSERTSGFAALRPRNGERAAEELERRLRRDSRRYDSGFYRY